MCTALDDLSVVWFYPGAMKSRSREHLAELAKRAEAGELTRSDAHSMFMELRDYAPPGSMVRDIGDSIVHDHRTRNLAHEYVNAFVEHMLRVFDFGGSLVVQTIFPIDKVLAQLMAEFDRHDVPIDGSALITQRLRLAQAFADVLDGTTIKLKVGVKGAIGSFENSDKFPRLLIQFGDEVPQVIASPAISRRRPVFPLQPNASFLFSLFVEKDELPVGPQ